MNNDLTDLADNDNFKDAAPLLFGQRRGGYTDRSACRSHPYWTPAPRGQTGEKDHRSKKHLNIVPELL